MQHCLLSLIHCCLFFSLCMECVDGSSHPAVRIRQCQAIFGFGFAERYLAFAVIFMLILNFAPLLPRRQHCSFLVLIRNLLLLFLPLSLSHISFSVSLTFLTVWDSQSLSFSLPLPLALSLSPIPFVFHSLFISLSFFMFLALLSALCCWDLNAAPLLL